MSLFFHDFGDFDTMRNEVLFQESPAKRQKRKAPTGDTQVEKVPHLANHDSAEDNSADSGKIVAYSDEEAMGIVAMWNADGDLNSPPRGLDAECAWKADVPSECQKISESLESLSYLRLRESRTCSYIRQLNDISRQLQMEEQDLIARVNAINSQRMSVNVRLDRAETYLCSIRAKREEKERALSLCCSKITELHEEKVNVLEILVKGLKTHVETLNEDRRRDHEAAVTRLEAEKEQQEAERARYNRDLQIAAQNLEKEVDKHICQICMTRSRNALVMPCMHFLYCSECLHAHQRRNNECPTCRGPISALIHCRLNMD